MYTQDGNIHILWKEKKSNKDKICKNNYCNYITIHSNRNHWGPTTLVIVDPVQRSGYRVLVPVRIRFNRDSGAGTVNRARIVFRPRGYTQELVLIGSVPSVTQKMYMGIEIFCDSDKELIHIYFRKCLCIVRTWCSGITLHVSTATGTEMIHTHTNPRAENLQHSNRTLQKRDDSSAVAATLSTCSPEKRRHCLVGSESDER